MQYYVVNKNSTFNPGFHHEVHTFEHAKALGIDSWIDLGVFYSEQDAVGYAQSYYYSDADGCAICCPKAHRG